MQFSLVVFLLVWSRRRRNGDSRDASYSREPVIFISFWVCHFEPVKRFRHLKWQQNDMLFLCQIAVISNDGIYTDFGISNAIFEQNQLQMTATLCIHQSSQNDRNLPDSKWNANDRFSTVGCVSNILIHFTSSTVSWKWKWWLANHREVISVFFLATIDLFWRPVKAAW